MAQIRTFRDLIVWQKSYELALGIYHVTKDFPQEEKFILASQIKRAAISVASNIVEGFRRRTIKDSLNFYNIAESSLEELKYQLILSLDLGFIAQEQFNEINSKAQEVGRTLRGWIKSNSQK